MRDLLNWKYLHNGSWEAESRLLDINGDPCFHRIKVSGEGMFSVDDTDAEITSFNDVYHDGQWETLLAAQRFCEIEERGIVDNFIVDQYGI